MSAPETARASPNTSASRPLLSSPRSSLNLARLGARYRTMRSKRPWVPAGIGRTRGGSAISLPATTSIRPWRRFQGHDRFHHGRPCFSTESYGPPIKARRRIWGFCTRSLLTSLSSRPRDHNLTISSRPSAWDVFAYLPPLPVPVRMPVFLNRRKVIPSRGYGNSCCWFSVTLTNLPTQVRPGVRTRRLSRAFSEPDQPAAKRRKVKPNDTTRPAKSFCEPKTSTKDENWTVFVGNVGVDVLSTRDTEC